MAAGYRSGLEDKVQSDLTSRGVPHDYEAVKVRYSKPASHHKYTPDFRLLANGILVETKGRFMTADRTKHELIKKQHPDLDIRFVFDRSKSPISKGSKTTYASWCASRGFLFADKSVPQEWVDEPYLQSRIDALEAARA
ncbi:hypothetical protein [Polymorphobacter arshaanensis]|uniref:hypothetical protein n=1 Tax=Glacieibacterium arshaanense TaxID=2511025 RepID=UPI001A9C7289|nr:hypothetical protein [Polymorphobacter arshaanensis]